MLAKINACHFGVAQLPTGVTDVWSVSGPCWSADSRPRLCCGLGTVSVNRSTEAWTEVHACPGPEGPLQ
jgi:hypothetical protein